MDGREARVAALIRYIRMSLVLRNALLPLLILIMVSSSTGCYPMKLAKGDKGVDVTSIQPGVTRMKAETALGPPMRRWVSTSIRHATYEYKLGLVPYHLPIGDQYIRDRIVLSYDDRDVILGIFNEFDDLPPNGRSGPHRWGPESPDSEK